MFEGIPAWCRRLWAPRDGSRPSSGDPHRRRRVRPAVEQLEERLVLNQSQIASIDFPVHQGADPTFSGSLRLASIPGSRVGDFFTITTDYTPADPFLQLFVFGAHAGGSGSKLLLTSAPEAIGGAASRDPHMAGPFDVVDTTTVIEGFIFPDPLHPTPDVHIRVTLFRANTRFGEQERMDDLGTSAQLAVGAAGLTLPAIGLLLEPPPAKVAHIAGTVLTALGGLVGLLAFKLQQTLEDPPDPNFTVIAKLAAPRFSRFRVGRGGLVPAEADAANALLANEAAIVGLLDAIHTSLNRADGASAAGNLFFEIRQLEAAMNYSRQLSQKLRAEPRLRARLARAFRAGGFGQFSLTPQDFKAAQQSVARDGLPASLTTALAGFGESPADIEQFRQSILTQPIPPAPVTLQDVLLDPGLLGAVRRLAGSLEIDPNPAGFQDVTGLVTVSHRGGRSGLVSISNSSQLPIQGPLVLVLDSLNRSLHPQGKPGVIGGPSPILLVNVPGNVLRPGGGVRVVIHGAPHFPPRVLARTGSGA